MTITVSTFTNPAHGRRVHQVMVGGMPITRELDDYGLALENARRALEHHARFGGGAKVETFAWDGDAGTLEPLAV